ncbi:MAG: 5'-methylthioadenosine/adenosylhomocysteine nucleosidase [Cytophagales bacterium]|nr:MAG: 5'-methylthioadenosine/adenosylhomocysteine nucleosidase [Cytophagales bacterium]
MKHLLLFLMLSPAFAQQPKKPLTALLGAFGAEVALVKQSLANPKSVSISGIEFTTGQIGKQAVVVAETGIGKVNAAMTTALLLNHFRPTRVIFTGIAGGTNPDLQPGDIVIGSQTGYHDFNSMNMSAKPTRQTLNPLTKALNPAFFPADPALLKQATELSKTVMFEGIPLASGQVSTRPVRVLVGTIVTGDQFISSATKTAQLRADFEADATEMEGAAVAQVCYQLQTPLLVIRSLSDRADAEAPLDIRAFYPTAARNSAKLVLALVKGL